MAQGGRLKLFLLILLNLALVVGLLVALQIFNIVDFSPIYSQLNFFRTSDEMASVSVEPRNLQEIENLNKEKETIQELKSQLEKDKSDLEKTKKELEMQQHTLSIMARDLDERERMLKLREMEKTDRDSRLNLFAQKLLGIRQQYAISMLIGLEISDIIAILRELDAIALSEGKPSIVSPYLEEMVKANPDKAREIAQAFIKYPAEEKLVPNE